MRKKTFQSEDKNVLSQPACLNRIYRSINSQGFTEETIQELRADIDYISGIYRTKEVGAVLLAAILEKSATDHLMDDEDLASYLGCTNIEFIRYHTDLCEMDKTGIIQLWGRGPRCSYRVTPETMRAVESNGEFKPVKLSGLTAEEFFTRLRKLFGSFRNDSINADRLLQELDSLINYNNHLSFCRQVLDSALYTECSDTERRMFLYLCHRYVTHGNKAVIIDLLTNFTDFMEDDECLKRHLANESTPLQRNGLVSFAIDEGFVNTDALSLSDKVKETFFTCSDSNIH